MLYENRSRSKSLTELFNLKMLKKTFSSKKGHGFLEFCMFMIFCSYLPGTAVVVRSLSNEVWSNPPAFDCPKHGSSKRGVYFIALVFESHLNLGKPRELLLINLQQFSLISEKFIILTNVLPRASSTGNFEHSNVSGQGYPKLFIKDSHFLADSHNDLQGGNGLSMMVHTGAKMEQRKSEMSAEQFTFICKKMRPSLSINQP